MAKPKFSDTRFTFYPSLKDAIQKKFGRYAPGLNKTFRPVLYTGGTYRVRESTVVRKLAFNTLYGVELRFSDNGRLVAAFVIYRTPHGVKVARGNSPITGAVFENADSIEGLLEQGHDLDEIVSFYEL